MTPACGNRNRSPTGRRMRRRRKLPVCRTAPRISRPTAKPEARPIARQQRQRTPPACRASARAASLAGLRPQTGRRNRRRNRPQKRRRPWRKASGSDPHASALPFPPDHLSAAGAPPSCRRHAPLFPAGKGRGNCAPYIPPRRAAASAQTGETPLDGTSPPALLCRMRFPSFRERALRQANARCAVVPRLTGPRR